MDEMKKREGETVRREGKNKRKKPNRRRNIEESRGKYNREETIEMYEYVECKKNRYNERKANIEGWALSYGHTAVTSTE